MVASDRNHGDDRVAQTQELIKLLGGAKRIAAWLGVTTSAVSNWCGEGAGVIPPAHHAALWRLAHERGVDWTPPGWEGVRMVPLHPREDDVNATSVARENSVKAPQGQAA